MGIDLRVRSGEQANAFWVLAVGGRRSKEREREKGEES